MTHVSQNSGKAIGRLPVVAEESVSVDIQIWPVVQVIALSLYRVVDTMRTRTVLYLQKTLYQAMNLLSAVMRWEDVDAETLIFGAQLRPTPHAAVPEVAVK